MDFLGGGGKRGEGEGGFGLSLRKALLFTSIADQSCPVAAPLVGLVVQTTDSEPSLDKAMLLTIGAPPRPLSECSCIVPNICSLRAVGCKRCGWEARGKASSTGAWYGSGGVQPSTVVESVRTKKLKSQHFVHWAWTYTFLQTTW